MWACFGNFRYSWTNLTTLPFKEKSMKTRTKWNIDEAGTLLRLILEHSQLPLDELKYRKFDKSFWLKLQEEMNRDYMHIHCFWLCYLHVQLFVECDIKLYKLRRKLFKLLRDSSYRVWSDIRWAEVQTHFPDGLTTRFLYKMCISLVRKHPNYLKTPLPELANFGLQTIQSSRYTNKRLKRLTLNDEGNLEVVPNP
ncbi:Uncharacterized protein OBRU01_22906 [Operophtera brumata]|uniref:Uncharacterized protein n=1 Tax=Operophtera brumata TaxID=104452 RepID=A0A0L7KPU2_OPEBR|nr:Uncharacterized protein OBRU01_22906 [Operophtera brumata]